MDKIKLGILTCSNTTKVLDCPVGACLKDMYERKGAFKQYKNKDVELVGIISCNGCPTLVGEAIIVPRIISFVHYGANVVHLSYCMLVLCPFIKKYAKVIKDNFPEIELILGTHEPHQTNHEFKGNIARMLQDRRTSIIP